MDNAVGVGGCVLAGTGTGDDNRDAAQGPTQETTRIKPAIPIILRPDLAA
jgi:hypothetical protein